MSRWVAVSLLLCGVVAPVSAQPYASLYTRPIEPAPEVLNRLNLKKAWSAYLPMTSREDAVAIVQPFEDRVIVQLRSSLILSYDLTTGILQWRYIPPKKFGPVMPVGMGGKYVFFVSGQDLYALDRVTGRVEFHEVLPGVATAGPVADSEIVTVPLTSNKLIGFRHSTFTPADPLPPPTVPYREPGNPYALSKQTVQETITSSNRSPSITVLPTLKPPYELGNNDRTPSVNILSSLKPPYDMISGNRSPSIALSRNLSNLEQLNEARENDKHLILLFEQTFDRGIDNQPIIRDDRILTATRDGFVYASASFENSFIFDFSASTGRIRRYPLDEESGTGRLTNNAIIAPIASTGERFFIPTTGSDLFAINAVTARVLWRYPTGGPINVKPFLTDDAVFVAGSGIGVTKVSMLEGDRIWIRRDADRVLAINPKYIYTLTSRNLLQIVDQKRGTVLGSLDVSAFPMPIVNETSDRLFLTANNGLLVCLHDHEYARPISPTKAAPAKKPAVKKQEEPKKEEPKKEEEKKE